MRIQRLDITGFKSFMDRSVFTFDDGITGVVGPNGCGKSNVVDSIRWVMGEQSAKNLRGRGMEDVIFNGSETQAPLSMAEVTMTFGVSESDTLPPQFAGLPEVSVTRRLFRNGDSEYQINKTTCRLLDVTELFLGTGVGTKAYSIIEQGRVGQIVSSRPEDRRAFIEEAAGVTKYKARRKAAERKMEHTQANLLRVNDIVLELERRIDSLDRQAKKAEKYKKLRAEVREIELHLSSHRFLELLAQKKVLDEQLSALTEEEKEGFSKLQALEQALAEKKEVIDAEARRLAELADEVHQLESQLQLDSQNIAHWTHDLAQTQQRAEQASSEWIVLSERSELTAQEHAAKVLEFSSLGTTSKEDDVALQVATEELRRATLMQIEMSTQLETHRGELVDLVQRLANHESALTTHGQRLGDVRAQLAKVHAEIEVLKDEETSLERSRNEVLSLVDHSRQLTLEIAQRRGDEESVLQRTRESFSESEIQVIRLRELLADKRSRLHSLEEIQRNYEGFDRGVRSVMLKAGSQASHLGIFGLVADLVTAPVHLEKAIEAALGDRLQHIVVESPEKALEWAQQLRDAAEGRSTFMPATVRRDTPVMRPSDLPAEWVYAAEQVTFREDALRGLVEHLLGDVVVVPTMNDAQSALARYSELTFVTQEGEVLRPGGVVTGGVLEGPAVGALQKKREIFELGSEVAALEGQYNETVTRHYELQKQMGHSEGVLKGLAKNQHAEEISLATHEKDLHQAGTQLGKIRERLNVLAREVANLNGTETTLLHEEESTRGEVAHCQADRESRDDSVRLLNAELNAIKAKVEVHQAEMTQLQVKVASSSEKREGMARALEQLETSMGELKLRIERLEHQSSESESHIAELKARIESSQSGRADQESLLERLRSELTSGRAEYDVATLQVREEEVEFKKVRVRLDSLTQGLSQTSMKEREFTLELAHLKEQVFERHQTDMAEALHSFHWRPQLTELDEKKLKDLRGQLERMGEVNLTAIEEHAQLRGRYEFLAKQKTDLEDSLAALQDAIRKIDATSRERFKETFEIVNEKFQAIFPRLFGGGRAQLILTDEGPGQEPGVDIIAQPPGKKLQSVNLFSGGEKALTAVALIFGIFLIKPTPFCLLDEVDAPLDEANVGRYNEMVREMSKQSQFILITHNKRTMEVADTLYGVTMEEPGISKLVSVRMHEAAAANSDASQVA